MATYNGSPFIKEQIESILEQLSAYDELVISDDGSTDNTLDVIREINDSRIKIYINSGVRGYSGNFENALSLASGAVIFLSDQDDIWFPTKVKLFLKALDHSDFVISDARVVDPDLNVLDESYFDSRSTSFGFLNSLIRCRYLGCCYAFKRNVLSKALPFPKKHKLLPHDLWLALVGESYFSVSYLKFPLVYYRRHSSNVSDGGELSSNNLVTKFKIRVYSLLNIAKVLFK
ncbi:glycosyltransferase family 2 protein [Shewanella sp. HL-SH5]|uniref:glycosyltransferase family 2 protein n=1 Tax=Shewanella sp. HL-SH5 TaxID=3436241 RepID=UPI003EB8842D